MNGWRKKKIMERNNREREERGEHKETGEGKGRVVEICAHHREGNGGLHVMRAIVQTASYPAFIRGLCCGSR